MNTKERKMTRHSDEVMTGRNPAADARLAAAIAGAGHTPGPWHHHADLHDDGKHCPCFAIFGGDESIVAHYYANDKNFIDGVGTVPDLEDARANARLIAAAPDLLAACEYAAQTIAAGAPNDDGPIAQHFSEAFDRLRSAIARAEGGAA